MKNKKKYLVPLMEQVEFIDNDIITDSTYDVWDENTEEGEDW